jgi:hypothetical protein
MRPDSRTTRLSRPVQLALVGLMLAIAYTLSVLDFHYSTSWSWGRCLAHAAIPLTVLIVALVGWQFVARKRARATDTSREIQ